MLVPTARRDQVRPHIYTRRRASTLRAPRATGVRGVISTCHYRERCITGGFSLQKTIFNDVQQALFVRGQSAVDAWLVRGTVGEVRLTATTAVVVAIDLEEFFYQRCRRGISIRCTVVCLPFICKQDSLFFCLFSDSIHACAGELQITVQSVHSHDWFGTGL